MLPLLHIGIRDGKTGFRVDCPECPSYPEGPEGAQEIFCTLTTLTGHCPSPAIILGYITTFNGPMVFCMGNYQIYFLI